MEVDHKRLEQYHSDGELTTSLIMAAQSLNQHIGFLDRDHRRENCGDLRELDQCEHALRNRPGQLNRKLKSKIKFLRANVNKWRKDTARKTMRLLASVDNPVRSEILEQWHECFWTFQAIYADYQAINWQTKTWELRHWFGLPQTQVTQIITLYQQWGLHGEHWNRLKPNARQALMKLFRPQHEESYDGSLSEPDLLPPAWEKYMKHRQPDNLLSKLVADKKCASFSADHPDMKILIMSTGGRTMVTLEDKLPVGEGKFNGASVTMILNEDSKYPSGGIQSLACTRHEALDLLATSASHVQLIKPDAEISIA